MSTDTLTSACAKCSHANDSAAKFCGGCGQPLWEKCVACEATVRIGTRFCGGCGDDLQQRLDRRLQQALEAFQRARQLAETFQYNDALLWANQNRKPADFRFQEIANKSTSLVEQIERAQAAWQAKSEKVLLAARRAAEAENHSKVSALVAKIPEPLRCEELNRLMAQSRLADSEFSQWMDGLREALKQKDHLGAASAVERLLQIKPQEPKFIATAEKIRDALLASASRRFDRGDYPATLQRLEAIPQCVRNDQTAAIYRRARIVGWLIGQFDGQPWASETLARIAQRLSQSVPNDPRAAELLDQYRATRKRPPSEPRAVHRPWDEHAMSWMGGPIHMLAAPQSLAVSDPDLLQKHPGEFFIALGLAIQGLGKGAFNETLYRAETKGLKKLFRRKGPRECVGIDAGSSAMRAVRVRAAEDGQLEIVELWRREYAQPLCRAGLDRQQTVLQESDLLALKEWMGDGEAEIWINQPARDVLGKFVEMPPIGDKELQPLVDKEVKLRFPLAAEELNLAKWIQPQTSQQSRQVVLVGAKKTLVDQRLAKLREFGIEPTAVQCEQAALINFGLYEFAGQLQARVAEESQPPPAIALLDMGASGATLLFLTPAGFVFRSVDGGGEELTGALARQTQLTAEQAEKWKRDPAVQPDPAAHFPVLVDRMRGMVSRLRGAYEEAQQQLGVEEVQTVWCVGSASLTHGWAAQWVDVATARRKDQMVTSDDDDDGFEIG